MAARYVIVTIIVVVRCNFVVCGVGEQCWFVGVLGCVLCCEEWIKTGGYGKNRTLSHVLSNNALCLHSMSSTCYCL